MTHKVSNRNYICHSCVGQKCSRLKRAFAETRANNIFDELLGDNIM